MRKKSKRRQIANQANAQLSTGPKTPEGKARSAANARTHGFCAAEILIAAEDRAEFEAMARGYDLDLRPQGATEQTLFEEVVNSAWQLRRIRRMETEICAGHTTYTAIVNDDLLQKKLDRLARHKTRIERTFHRCLTEFKKIQNERFAEDKAFHSMQSLIDARVAQQNSERTQPQPEPAAAGALPPDFFEKVNQEFEEIDRGLAKLGRFVTPPKLQTEPGDGTGPTESAPPPTSR